jgi:exopolysaccharide biosynthesis polyprenyl glycosylphosphotransferase
MERPPRRSDRRLIFVLGDLIAAVSALCLALWTWSLTAGFPFTVDTVVRHAQWWLAVPLWVMALAPSRRASAAFHLGAAARGLLQAACTLFVAYLLAFFAAGPERLPRLLALYLLWNSVWLTLAMRLLLVWSLTRAGRARRVVVLGQGDAASAAVELLREPAYADAVLVGPCADHLPTGIGAVSEVIVAQPDRLSAPVIEQLMTLQATGTDVSTFVQVHEHLLRRVPVRHIGHDWIVSRLFGADERLHVSYLAKRTIDLGGALVLAVFGLVPGLLAAIAVAIESGFPVFYSQTRSGRGGRTFRLTKLRTMRQDAEAAGPQWSPEGDPRITVVGRVLRRTHLDELPNLWAVLVGHMSLVGPRPERPEFIEHLEREIPLYRSRLTVTPGLTGWAQVKTAYGDSVEDALRKLEYDLYYIRHQSLWFDLSILVRTAGRMLGWKGR